MISDKRFDISSGADRVFNSDFPIKGKLYVRVWVDAVGNDVWVGLSPSKFNIINDNVVFDEAPKGKFLNLQVATVPSELQASPSEIATIVSLKEEIKDLDSIKDAISGVDSIKDSVVTTAGIKKQVVEVALVEGDIKRLAGEIDNIEENKDKAEKAYQDTVKIKEDTQQLKEDTQKIKEDTQQIKTQTDSIKDATAQDKMDIDGLKNEATQIRDEIKQIEGNIKNIDSIPAIDAKIAKKADKTYVDEELTKKADKTYTDSELAKKASTLYVDGEVKKVIDVIPEISKQEIFTYYGKELITLPITPYRGYYMTFYAIQNEAKGLDLPDVDLEVGTVVLINNADINSSFRVRPRSGETIDNSSSINIPNENVIYLVKTSATAWSKGFGGYMSPSFSRVVADIKLALKDELGGGTGQSLLTVVGDDENTINVGVDSLDFPSTIVETDPQDSKKVTLKPYINTKFMTKDSLTGASSTFKANQLEFLPPLQGYSDPDKDLGVIVELKHNQFEEAKAPNYLAYLQESEELVTKEHPIDNDINRATLWFDDVVVPSGAFISIDRNNKAIGLQEWDEKDPNVTGGDAFLIAYRVSLKGVAPDDGFVRLSFTEKTSGFPAEDANGMPMSVQRNYKQGETLDFLELVDIIDAKGLKYYQCIVEHNFTSDVLILEDRTEGVSGVMVQSINGDEKTGTALLQYENDTVQNIEFSTHYLGEDVFTLAPLLTQSKPLSNISAGEGQTLNDGFHLYNSTPLKAGWVDNHLRLTATASDLAYFNLGKIFSAEKSLMMRGKEINITVTLTDKQNAFKVSLLKWSGNPDEYTKKIITGVQNSQPILEANWSIVDTMFISEDVVVGEHSATKKFTIPDDGRNFAFVIYPNDEQNPMDLQLKAFKGDMVNPYLGHVIEYPQDNSELHLAYSKQYARFITDKPSGYGLYRFTLNKAEAKIPAGVKLKGEADVELAKNWVVGYDSGAEGDLKFKRDGNAEITTTVRAYSGESVPDGGTSIVNVWWAKKQPNGSFSKIADSEVSTTLKKADKNAVIKLPTFTFQSKANDELRLLASSNIDDGAYLQTSHIGTYLSDTVISFDEVSHLKDTLSSDYYDKDKVLKLSDLKADLTYVNNKPSGLKNYIINGGFDVWQRGTSFINYGYIADRWRVETGGGGYDVDAGISTGVNNRNSLFMSRGGSSAGNMAILQRIEANSTAPIVGKTMTVSFYAKLEGAENTLDFIVWTPSSLVKDSWGGRTYSEDSVEMSETISVTGAFAKYTYTFTVPANAVYGMAIGFQSLGDTNYVNKMYISEVQLEEGSVATPFEHLSKSLIIQQCRYYYRKSDTQLDVGDLAYEMRTTPTEVGTAPYTYDAEL